MAENYEISDSLSPANDRERGGWWALWEETDSADHQASVVCILVQILFKPARCRKTSFKPVTTKCGACRLCVVGGNLRPDKQYYDSTIIVGIKS